MICFLITKKRRNVQDKGISRKYIDVVPMVWTVQALVGDDQRIALISCEELRLLARRTEEDGGKGCSRKDVSKEAKHSVLNHRGESESHHRKVR